MVPFPSSPPSLHPPSSSASSPNQRYGRRDASIEVGLEVGAVGGREGGRVGGRDADIVHHVGRSIRMGRRKRGRERRRCRTHREGMRLLVVVRMLHGPWRGKRGGRDVG